MPFENDPFWIRLRWAFVVFFIGLFIVMLVSAVAIVALAPGCADKSEKWFHRKLTYHIYPRSYQDSDGDGNGDLKGESFFLGCTNAK